MNIKEVFYKDVPAFELTTKTVRAVIVPAQGGKMASFQSIESGKEYLLQNPSPTFLRMGLQDAFEQRECAGFDDMFPTIDPLTVTCEDGTSLYHPDHGEVCRLPFTPITGGVFLTLRRESATLGYSYQKTFSEDTDGALRIGYRIENTSPRDLNVLWAAHFLLNVEHGGKLLLPFEEGEPVDVMFDLSGKLQAGERVPLRNALLLSDWPQDSPACRKLYFPRKAPEGYLAYRGPKGDVLRMEFDNEQLPYIGLWINLGHLHGDYCVGLEPATHGYDTVKNAEAYGQRRLLKKGECLSFFLRLSVQ